MDEWADGASDDQTWDYNGELAGDKLAQMQAWKYEFGSVYHSKLDEYNNYGTVDGIVYACDRDDAELLYAASNLVA